MQQGRQYGRAKRNIGVSWILVLKQHASRVERVDTRLTDRANLPLTRVLFKLTNQLAINDRHCQQAQLLPT